MTYNEFIQDIINTRGQWSDEVRYSERGCERHHIIPKCLGGEPKRLNWYNHENVIWLYPKEHFIAHKLLAEENPDNLSLLNAYSIMAFCKKDNMHRDDYELTPEEYEEARYFTSIANKNKIFTEETREKLSNSLKGHDVSDETRRKISDKLTGTSHSTSNETKLKISTALKGKNKSDDAKKHMSDSAKGRTPWNKGQTGIKVNISEEGSDKLRQCGKLNGTKNAKAVYCIELDMIFRSAKDAVKELNLSINDQRIRRSCNCNDNKLIGGYHWRWA